LESGLAIGFVALLAGRGIDANAHAGTLNIEAEVGQFYAAAAVNENPTIALIRSRFLKGRQRKSGRFWLTGIHQQCHSSDSPPRPVFLPRF
jgi:hypothetical protein